MTWRWIDKGALLRLHGESLARHGGSPGLRDEGLLDSALGRPLNLAAYDTPDFAALAAAYGVGLAKNHPFVDGNKRAAFLAVGLFLRLNGCADAPYRACHNRPILHQAPETAMPTIHFDPRTERELSVLAARSGRNLEELVRDVVRDYLDEQADIDAADAAYGRYLSGQEKTVSLDELERRLGLES